MDSIPERVNKSKIGQPSEDFEVLLCHRDRTGWHSHCQLFPPPPYVHEHSYSEISSYSVVSGGSLICISVKDRGTYVLDTASRHLWEKVGDWKPPFQGKVEYVPELKLWFGLSADAKHLVAADLSTVDSQPQIVGHWKNELCPREEWIELRDVRLVNLGSGRFCIARFFVTSVRDDFGFRLYDETFVVLTGVEVVPRVLDGNGEVKLEMIPHKSRRHTPVNGASIEEVF
ncbi:hypothetical protein HU200_051944 [Digitaria exilis]|uniref:F-box protein n=1 Tax=Digitaria exilis TaxID=1010633 RepID=A0A835AZM0_9POAL|nr:hypothetical protein HU200_051944 [Digitaria exilis]